MTTTVNIRTYDIVVDAPAEAVFDFVSDLRNLPRWSIHYCRGVRLIDDVACVTTRSGHKALFGMVGDRGTGVLDWWSGIAKEHGRRWPTRVVPLPDGRSLYQIVAVFDGEVPPDFDQLFREELEMLKTLVEARAETGGTVVSVA